MPYKTFLKYFWASPVSILGVIMVLPARLLGGSAHVHSGVLEITLSPSRRRWYPFSAITLGHVVIAISPKDQERFRSHERVHIAQYERWGVLLLPAYLLESLWQWLAGKHPYLDNRFEVQARYLAGSSSADRARKIL